MMRHEREVGEGLRGIVQAQKQVPELTIFHVADIFVVARSGGRRVATEKLLGGGDREERFRKCEGETLGLKRT